MLKSRELKCTIKSSKRKISKKLINVSEKMREVPDTPARINPDRKWFGNVRTINQKTLENLRKEMESSKANTKAYSILLKSHKVPKSLLTPLNNVSKTNKLHASFKETFGPESRRTKPTLSAFTVEELSSNVDKKLEDYNMDKDRDYLKKFDRELKGPETKYMSYGQSKRIFSELHKVIDSSDVICTVLDARDPINTRCTYVENFVKKNAPHKHVVLVLNKCDLIPTWATVIVFINIGCMG
jgi:nuclear GTP-binding protein